MKRHGSGRRQMKRGACRNSTRKSPPRIGAKAYRFPNLPHNAAADVEVVLPAFAGIHPKSRRARPEIPHLAAHLERTQELHVQANSQPEHPARRSPLGFFPPNSSCEPE